MPWGTGETPLQLGEGDRKQNKMKHHSPGAGAGTQHEPGVFCIAQKQECVQKGMNEDMLKEHRSQNEETPSGQS